MLSQLYIRNIAVIQEATIELAQGLNVFTGETGAGKTILINAINAVLPAGAAVVLVLLSVVLTLIGGLIPSRKAAKQDPVKALRTE